jgi:putative secretion ATPase (PEP-CTERM system associated)
MYERFFHLRERPFALTPDPDYLYPSRVHREALGYLRYGLESHAGFVVITGEIGSGKTTLLQALLRGLDAQTTVVRLMNTLLEPRELLEAIAIDLGIAPGTASKPALLHALAAQLVEERQAGRMVLLVIDEAQNLGLPALEEIRMLSNLETEKSKLLQIVLVGQPDLREKLAMRQLEQFRQRITVSYHLESLDPDETAAYINHRLRRASLGAPLQFSREVTDIIHQQARGVPRLINVICDAVLVFAYADERRVIDPTLLVEVHRELQLTGVLAADVQPPARQGVTSEVPVDWSEARLPSPSNDQGLPPMLDLSLRDMAEKEDLLRLREEEIARRETQIADQQRVLAEEYRLFRSRQSHEAIRATQEAGVVPHPPKWPPLSSPSLPSDRVADGHPPGPVAPFVVPFAPPEWTTSAPRQGFWRRMKQAFFGAPQAVGPRQ